MRHEEASFSSDGLTFYEQRWLPDGDPKAVVVLVHGYAEHSGRYVHVGQFLSDRGYAVEAYDLRGHGKSEGKRVLVKSIDEHLADLDLFLTRTRGRYPNLPLFLLGHSMGGAIMALYVIRSNPDSRGVVLSAPAISSRTKTPRWVQRLIMIIGGVLPRLRLTTLAAADVSRDPEVVRKYDSDPLVYRGRVPAGTVAAMIRAGREVHARMEDFRAAALLLLHGEEDQLADPAGSRELFERASTADKTLKVYRQLFHEVFNEPEQKIVLGDLADWLDARL